MQGKKQKINMFLNENRLQVKLLRTWRQLADCSISDYWRPERRGHRQRVWLQEWQRRWTLKNAAGVSWTVCKQSAYRRHHSTETAVLMVYDDIVTAVDRGQLTPLVLLAEMYQVLRPQVQVQVPCFHHKYTSSLLSPLSDPLRTTFMLKK